ncbi:hypothetical protein BpHYR1_014456 [Brachionus plicatilis]|uniref:Uncharacterized protein n=1 Tax=Brachionus plicatilis TaxID=10195 RepID=A0A3M7PTB8_BRAPC|nr:hypothetical protein BpHYR1_014456 [Brachionus plicatilis]
MKERIYFKIIKTLVKEFIRLSLILIEPKNCLGRLIIKELLKRNIIF